MYDSVEHIEDFTVDGNGYAQDEPEHDAAGNLTYDGQYAYTYDAWNRMVASHRAFRSPSGTGTLTLGSTVLAVRYDGLGRRIERTITHSGDFDATYHDYHDPGGHSVIEIRNGSNLVLKQHVWAAPAHGYIDELVQVALNADPFTDEDFTDTGPGSAGGRFYFALQDANYNVLALVAADGSLAERYEYTPYGQRQVYYSPGTNDPKLHAPYLTSRRWKVGSGGAADQPYGLNDLGHQGLHHDEVLGPDAIHNRARDLKGGRFRQRDPLGYIDGMNLFAAYTCNPIRYLDRTGLFVEESKVSSDIESFKKELREHMRKVAGQKGFPATDDGINQVDWYEMMQSVIAFVDSWKHKYVWTATGGWIDMKHMLSAATEKNVWYQPGFAVLSYGWSIEEKQAQQGSMSAFGVEDLPSNKFGAWFEGSHFEEDNLCTLPEQIESFFNDVLGGLPAPPKEKIPLFNTIRNLSDEPIVNPGTGGDVKIHKKTGFRYRTWNESYADKWLEIMLNKGINPYNKPGPHTPTPPPPGSPSSPIS